MPVTIVRELRVEDHHKFSLVRNTYQKVPQYRKQANGVGDMLIISENLT